MKYRIEVTEIEPGGLQGYEETIYTQLVSEDDFDLQAIIAAVNFESYPDSRIMDDPNIVFHPYTNPEIEDASEEKA